MADINRDFFFAQARKTLFSGKFTQSQVDGINSILDSWEATYSDQDDRWLAYALATTFHETAMTMQPIEEYGHGRGRPYGIPDPVTGQTYYGRGFVQLTWKRNYATMAEKIGADLVNHPELALNLDYATKIMYVGMIEGLFTGKALKDYFNSNTEDWVGARRIINGQDRAQEIAQYGHKFYAAIAGPQ
jgi:hypothetical protein